MTAAANGSARSRAKQFLAEIENLVKLGALVTALNFQLSIPAPDETFWGYGSLTSVFDSAEPLVSL